MWGFSGINTIAYSYSKPQRVECLAKNEKPKVIRDKGKKGRTIIPNGVAGPFFDETSKLNVGIHRSLELLSYCCFPLSRMDERLFGIGNKRLRGP